MNYKKVIILIGIVVFSTVQLQAQCSFGGTDSGVTVTPNPTAQLTSNITAGQYFMMNVVSGGTYTVSTCGLTSWDTQLTVYTSTGTFVAYNDDSSGCGFRSVVNFTAPASGQVRVMLNQYFCASSSNSTQVEYSGTAPTPLLTLNALSVDETEAQFQ